MNILITSIGNKVNLCRYFRRALFNEGGGQLIAYDCNPLVNGREFVDRFLCAPLLTDSGFKSWLLEQIKLHHVDLVIPSRDEDVSYLASIQSQLVLDTNVRILVPSAETVELCQDKSRFGLWCFSKGFYAPKQVDLLDADLIFPLFVKPNSGSGSKGTLKINSEQEWQQLKGDFDKSFIVQEFIDGDEYTVDVFLDQQGRVRTVVPRKRISVLDGESVRAEVVIDEAIISECTRLSTELSLVGHNTIQCFKKDGRVIFCEVNLRYGGGFTLGVEAGADTPRYLVRELKGLDALPNPVKLVSNMKMLRVQKDVFIVPARENVSKKTFCFDLDGTICTEFCRYEDAEPMPHIVNKINQLYDAGHNIVISTARGAASGVCWRELIEKQLAHWGVRYHLLHTSKPFADFYIDNKSVDVLDFI